MRVTLTCLCLAVMASPVMAYKDYILIGVEMGSLLGSDEACGLQFDQSAVLAYIEKNADPKDLNVASTLKMMTQGTRIDLAKLNAVDLAAQCLLAKRSAEALGLLAPK